MAAHLSFGGRWLLGLNQINDLDAEASVACRSIDHSVAVAVEVAGSRGLAAVVRGSCNPLERPGVPYQAGAGA